ncbi:MAG: hypothetical protein Q8P81_04695 [Nanoarchaeota archaeon]|nr:hypothetical protein [Nanoarchaeota archaeon]
MVENVLRIRYREDLDMPERITKDTYRKQRHRTKIHEKRILGSLSRVEDSSGDETGIHLDFCLTGYYPRGRHYICAVWPDQPASVDFYFRSKLEYENLFSGWVFGPHHSNLDDPKIITVDLSRRSDAAPYLYIFFSQDPHKSHRPYFFGHGDALFTRQDQDDEKVLDFHSPGVIESWRRTRDKANNLARGNLSVEQLSKLGEFTGSVEHKFERLFGKDSL